MEVPPRRTWRRPALPNKALNSFSWSRASTQSRPNPSNFCQLRRWLSKFERIQPLSAKRWPSSTNCPPHANVGLVCLVSAKKGPVFANIDRLGAKFGLNAVAGATFRRQQQLWLRTLMFDAPWNCKCDLGDICETHGCRSVAQRLLRGPMSGLAVPRGCLMCPVRSVLRHRSKHVFFRCQ